MDNYGYGYDVKALQAEAMAAFERDMAQLDELPDPLHNAQATLSLQLIMARLHKGLSQAELAKRVGLRQPAISRIENGRGNPRLRMLLALAKALELDLVLE